MAEPNTDGKKQQVEMEMIYNVEQKASLNTFLDIEVNGEPFHVQVTVRHGVTAEQLSSMVQTLANGLTLARSVFPKPDKPVSVNVENHRPGERKSDGDGTYENPKSFVPSKLVVNFDNGKEYFKVVGQEGKFPKFPVTIWPEVIEEAGINAADAIDPKDGYKLEGWVAYYVVNEKGNPAKVIKLEQKFP